MESKYAEWIQIYINLQPMNGNKQNYQHWVCNLRMLDVQISWHFFSRMASRRKSNGHMVMDQTDITWRCWNPKLMNNRCWNVEAMTNFHHNIIYTRILNNQNTINKMEIICIFSKYDVNTYGNTKLKTHIYYISNTICITASIYNKYIYIYLYKGCDTHDMVYIYRNNVIFTISNRRKCGS